MGLIRAAMGAAGGVMTDQWKEYFYCEAMPADLLATRGWKRQSGRSANTKGNDNIISNGSIVAVADGQCAMIVEQGKVVDMCAEPGEYTYDTGRRHERTGAVPDGRPAVGRRTARTGSGICPRRLDLQLWPDRDISITLNTYTHVKFDDAKEELLRVATS